eukprot:m51a1_g53 putative camk cdpk protein kinase (453) ;mRNA; f:172533-174210
MLRPGDTIRLLPMGEEYVQFVFERAAALPSLSPAPQRAADAAAGPAEADGFDGAMSMESSGPGPLRVLRAAEPAWPAPSQSLKGEVVDIADESSSDSGLEDDPDGPIDFVLPDQELMEVRRWLTAYQIGDSLGRGTFGTVWRGVHKASGTQCAIKSILSHLGTGSNRGLTAKDELELLKAIHHENVIRLYDAVETPTRLYLVLELATGGNLFDSAGPDGTFPEDVARDVSLQLFRAIEYLHSHHIAHRDLKPENILFETKGGTRIKLADFGLGRFYDNSGYMQTAVGTPLYMAPEIKTRHYSSAVDLWSAGAIIFRMLSGSDPFTDSTSDADLQRKIQRGQFEFTSPRWNIISEEAKDLISRLLVVDPERRMTATEALCHDWITGARLTYAPASAFSCDVAASSSSADNGSPMHCDTMESEEQEAARRRHKRHAETMLGAAIYDRYDKRPKQ